jgi:translocation and assembly module TamA
LKIRSARTSTLPSRPRGKKGLCRWLFVFTLFALFAIASPRVQGQTVDGYTVEINGVGKLKPLLTEHLPIQRYADDEMRLEELQRLVENTPQKIRELLATEGYFSPTIERTLEQQGGRWVARFDVTPGPPTRIKDVDIKFSGQIAKDSPELRRMNRLRRQWGLEPGERFRQEEWNAAKNAILKGLLNRNYPAARIANSEARVDPEQRTASLSVEVDSGPAFTFGELQIQGLERYSRDMIDRLNPIEPGDPFSQEKLSELQTRLQDTGYFRSAFATINVDPDNPQRVPIRLDLTEVESNRLALGVGISSDTGPNVQVKWLNRNFLDRQWRLESELRIDRDTRLLGADVFLPAIRNGWLPSVGARYERTDIAGEVNNKIRAGGQFASPDKDNEHIWSASYLADRQEVPDIEPAIRQALIASYGYTIRRLNNRINPRRGYVASASLSVGPQGLLNEEGLVRVLGRATRLHPIAQRWDTVLRGEIGHVFGAGRATVPADLLFRTGGNQSVRGYDYNSLGVPVSGAIVAGPVMSVVSAELIYRINQQWGAAVFVDAGDAADSWSDFRWNVGTGVGARWRSPIGPVNIDLAYGHTTRKPQLHFSIGYGF